MMKEQNCLRCGKIAIGFIPICDNCLNSKQLEREYKARELEIINTAKSVRDSYKTF